MFCPQCGEVIGSGPLDVRRTAPRDGDGVARRLVRWLRAALEGRG